MRRRQVPRVNPALCVEQCTLPRCINYQAPGREAPPRTILTRAEPLSEANRIGGGAVTKS